MKRENMLVEISVIEMLKYSWTVSTNKSQIFVPRPNNDAGLQMQAENQLVSTVFC